MMFQRLLATLARLALPTFTGLQFTTPLNSPNLSKARSTMRTVRIGSPTLSEFIGSLWRYRHLCLHLSSSDLRSRFRGSSLGVLWAMINPLVFALMYATVLGALFNQDTRALSVYVLAGVVLWEALSSSALAGSYAFINAAGYLKQAAVPLILFPIRMCLTLLGIFALGLLSLLIYSTVLSFLGVGNLPTIYWAWVPAIAAAVFAFSIPVAVLAAILHSKFRDTQQVLALASQAVWFTSPVLFTREIFDQPSLAPWTRINPVAAFCDLLRAPTLYAAHPAYHSWVVVAIWTVVLWIIALIALKAVGRKIVFLV